MVFGAHVMKLQIIKLDNNNIAISKDFSDANDRGEISHFIVELEIIKHELLKLWKNLKE